MHFTRLIVKNVEVEKLQESPTLIYFVAAPGRNYCLVPEENNHIFKAESIELLDNGWVLVTSDDVPGQCFPPWRVIALEDYDPTDHGTAYATTGTL